MYNGAHDMHMYNGALDMHMYNGAHDMHMYNTRLRSCQGHLAPQIGCRLCPGLFPDDLMELTELGLETTDLLVT